MELWELDPNVVFWRRFTGFLGNVSNFLMAFGCNYVDILHHIHILKNVDLMGFTPNLRGTGSEIPGSSLPLGTA